MCICFLFFLILKFIRQFPIHVGKHQIWNQKDCVQVHNGCSKLGDEHYYRNINLLWRFCTSTQCCFANLACRLAMPLHHCDKHTHNVHIHSKLVWLDNFSVSDSRLHKARVIGSCFLKIQPDSSSLLSKCLAHWVWLAAFWQRPRQWSISASMPSCLCIPINNLETHISSIVVNLTLCVGGRMDVCVRACVCVCDGKAWSWTHIFSS